MITNQFYCGQARKSLWIETFTVIQRTDFSLVRLVRACGSKQLSELEKVLERSGQARKSLWIETTSIAASNLAFSGQARKSLWIETLETPLIAVVIAVRLVRACGSKHPESCTVYH